MRMIMSIVLVCFATDCFAQDAAFLQKALAAIQAQRNLALDSAAVADAKLAATMEDLAKAQIRIKELEAKDKPATDGK